MTVRDQPLMLVIDDEAALRLMMQATLQQAGFAVEEATNCQEGIAAFQRLQPDLILLDVMMPDGDGFGVCRQIRALPGGRDLPIVMVTGLDDTESINAAYQSGATDFITKPINWAVVGHRVRYILRASRAMAELKVSEGRNRALIAAMPDLILRLNRSGACLDYQLGANTPWEALLGNDPLAGIGLIFPDEQIEGVRTAVCLALDNRVQQALEYSTGTADDPRYLELRFTALDTSEVLAIVRDITERRKIESTLKQWGTVFESIADAIVVTGADRRIQTVNRACLQLTGYSDSELRGQHPRMLVDPDRLSELREVQLKALSKEGYWQGETWARRKSGELFAVFTAITQVRNADGEVVNYILILSDITEKKSAEARIEYLAHRDPVTGLANRSLFNYRLGVALGQCQRTHGKLAVLFIDLDRFKTVNDSLGHAFGDKLLKMIADRLESCTREGDTVSRLGGDEFAMLMANVEAIDDVVAQCERVLAKLDQPCAVEDQVLRISASIGVSVYPDDGQDIESLVKNADAAMYLAKDSGRNNFQFFTAELNAKAIERFNLEGLLRTSIERSELELHYQPQVDTQSSALIGCEALIRWRSPELGLVAPGRFISLAEEIGLILPIGDWIIKTACEQIRAWHAQGLSPIAIAINISAVQFEQKNFVRNLIQQVKDSGVDPRWLELELTESMVMRDVEGVVSALHELKSAGFTLAVDDFGTGYSSLSYLRRLPIDVLKIDQSFVRGMLDDRASLAIVETVVALAKAMGLRSIAEGVETEDELTHLRALNCEHAQGYFFGKPMLADDFCRWRENWQKQHAE